MGAFSEDNFIKSELRGDIRLGLASPEIRYSAGFNRDHRLFCTLYFTFILGLLQVDF